MSISNIGSNISLNIINITPKIKQNMKSQKITWKKNPGFNETRIKTIKSMWSGLVVISWTKRLQTFKNKGILVTDLFPLIEYICFLNEIIQGWAEGSLVVLFGIFLLRNRFYLKAFNTFVYMVTLATKWRNYILGVYIINMKFISFSSYLVV